MPPIRRTTTEEFVRGSVRGSVRGTRRRALATLPSLFTLANMMLGFAAILVSIRGDFRLAAVLIGLSIVFDITDGAVARLVGAVTPFGLQFDSLADLVSFGLAPALLAFTLFSQGRDEWDPLGWIACFVWLACAAIRLARFNTTVDPTADKRYFVGLPSPGAAGVVLASVFAFGDQMQGRDRLWVLLVVVVPALLMVSKIRFRSFRSLVSPKSGRPYGLIAVGILLVVGFALAPVVTGLALAYGYLLAPLLLPILSPLGRLMPSRLKEALS
jgi:CDP-diacylglycerol--serine O-phosphatidyltransferase